MFSKYFNTKKSKIFQYTFDDVYETLPRINKKVSNDEKLLLKTYLRDIDDEKFVNIIISLFDKGTTIDIIRQIANTKGFDTDFNVVKAFEAIKKIYLSLGEGRIYNNLKSYLFMLIFEPMEYMKEMMKDIHDTHIMNLDNTVSDLLHVEELKVYDGHTPCLLSMICQNSTEAIHELFTQEFSNDCYEITEETDEKLFDTLIKSVYSYHDTMNAPAQAGDNTIKGGNAEYINIIDTAYDRLLEINRNKSDNKDEYKGYMNEILEMEKRIVINYTDEVKTNTKILEYYVGNYKDNIVEICKLIKSDVIKMSPERLNAVKNTLILNVDNFNALFNDDDKNIVSTFVVGYRKVFNKLCFESTNNYIKSNRIAVTEETSITDKLGLIHNMLNKKTSQTGGMFKHLPLKKTAVTTTQLAQKQQIKPAPKVVTNVSNVNSVNQQPVKQEPEKVIVYREVPQSILGGDNKVNNTGAYIENIMTEQKNFNKAFEGLYRELIKSFTTVSIDNVKEQNSKLFECVYSLKSIQIDSSKTSVYISGLYQAKNWNKQYILACKRVVSTINENGNGLFNNVIANVEKIITLCEETAKKANEYVTSYMLSTKETSEIIGNISKVVKIPCRLTKEELNTYRENLQKLLSCFASISNETSAYSLKQQMNNYINNVRDRSDLIREYFRNKDEQSKIGANSIFNRDRMEIISQLNNQMKECLLYLNDVLDIKLAKHRETAANKIEFDNKTFEKFEKAMIQFKDISNNQELIKTIDKIKEAIYENDDKSKHERRMFNLLKSVQKFWKQSGYIDFIIQLYNEFNIFTDGFNWSQFRDMTTLLLSLVNINTSTIYDAKITSEAFLATTSIEIPSVSFTNYVSIGEIAKKINDKIINHTIYDNTKVSAGTILANRQSFIPVLQTTIQQMLSYTTNSSELVGKTTTFNGEANTLFDYTITFSNKRFKFDLTTNENNENIGELNLANMIFDAMLVNILNVVNKYAEIKYTGNFNLPIQLNTLIKGGNIVITDENGKEYGGNVYDVLSVNDNNYDEVITEAVPFYISAFNILIFYYRKYGPKSDKTATEPNLYFNISKLSPLYPITSKLEAYGVENTSSLNMQLIKCGVGVFNTYWRKASGDTPSSKLSNSIDMILNEVNACMIYTTQLQYESMKVTGKLSNNFLSSLQTNINNLSSSLTKAMQDSIVDLSMNNEQQAIMFENILSRSYEKVKSAPQNEKLNALMQLLTSINNENDNASGLYKFIDLGLMPLLTTCISYNNIFSLFSLVDSINGPQQKEYDLSKWFIHVPINIDDEYKDMSVWEAIEFVRKNYRSSDDEKQLNAVLVKNLLETCSAVNEYNTFVLSNTIYDVLYNNTEYSTPSNLWYPVYIDSYPTSPIIRSKITSNTKINDDIKLIIYQLYPYSNGNTLYDYFVTALSEFASDVDHCIHLLLSYPNIHDKFIKSISSTVHKFIDNKETFIDRFGITTEQKQMMEKIPMNEKLTYIRPPPYKNGYFVPQFTSDSKALLPSISVYNAGEFIPNSNISTFSFFPIDGYNQNIVINSDDKQRNIISNYSWTDWVIQKIADCDTAFSCIPYKLVQLLQQQSILSRKLQTIVYEAPTNKPQIYSFTSSGTIYNPITTNIITRSLSQTNQDKTRDNGIINKQWVSNLVGIIPYIVNKLKVYGSKIDYNASYDNTNTKSELNVLSTCLITFYNDLISATPKIGFMENTTMFEHSANYHAIAELVPYLIRYNIENIGSSDYSKYEWANKYFFSGITDLVFPEYQTFDRFEKIKKFGSDIFANALFANEFDTVKSILAKSLWSSGIIVSNINSINSTPDRDFYKYMMMAINISAELTPNIAEKFVRNCVNILRNDYETKKVGTSKRLLSKDGDIVSPDMYTKDIREKLKEIVNNIRKPSGADSRTPFIIPNAIKLLLNMVENVGTQGRIKSMFGGKSPNTNLMKDEIDDIINQFNVSKFNDYIDELDKSYGDFNKCLYSDSTYNLFSNINALAYGAYISGTTTNKVGNWFLNNNARYPDGFIVDKYNNGSAKFRAKLRATYHENFNDADTTISDILLTNNNINDIKRWYKGILIERIVKNEDLYNNIRGLFGDIHTLNNNGGFNHDYNNGNDNLGNVFGIDNINRNFSGSITYNNIIEQDYEKGYITNNSKNISLARDSDASQGINATIIALIGLTNASTAANPAFSSKHINNIILPLIAVFSGHHKTTANDEAAKVIYNKFSNDIKNVINNLAIADTHDNDDNGNVLTALTNEFLGAINEGDDDATKERALTNIPGVLDAAVLCLQYYVAVSLSNTLSAAFIERKQITQYQNVGFDNIHDNTLVDIMPHDTYKRIETFSGTENRITVTDILYSIYIILYLYGYLSKYIDINTNLAPIKIDNEYKINDKMYYIFDTNDIRAYRDLVANIENNTYFGLYKFIKDISLSISSDILKFKLVLARSLYVLSDNVRYNKAKEFARGLFNIDDTFFTSFFDAIQANLSSNINSIYECLTINENALNTVKDVTYGINIKGNKAAKRNLLNGEQMYDGTIVALSKFVDNYILPFHYINMSAVADILFNCEPTTPKMTANNPTKPLNYGAYTVVFMDDYAKDDKTTNLINSILCNIEIAKSYKETYNKLIDNFDKLYSYYQGITNNPIFKGGYNENDSDVFVRVLLSGLIDITNMPYNSYDDVMGEKTYTTAIQTAGRLLNCVKNYKIKATMPQNIFNPITTLNNNVHDIYEYLSTNNLKKADINTIDDTLYLFPPNIKNNYPVSSNQTYIYDSNVYKNIWNKYQSKKLIKQLQPIFILFDNSLELGGNIDINIGNIKNIINKAGTDDQVIEGLLAAIKIMLYRKGDLSKDIHKNRNNTVAGFTARFNKFKACEDPETNDNDIGIPGFLTNWKLGYDFINGNRLFTEENENNKVILGGYIGVLGAMMDMNKLCSMVTGKQFNDKISILKGIYIAIYIKSRMYDEPTIFRGYQRIDCVTYVNDVSYGYVIDNLPNIGNKALVRAYNKPSINGDLLDKYTLMRAEHQPVLNLSKYDFILRDTHSIFGRYSLLNPWHNLLNCSWNNLNINDVDDKINNYGTNTEFSHSAYSEININESTNRKYAYIESVILRHADTNRIVYKENEILTEMHTRNMPTPFDIGRGAGGHRDNDHNRRNNTGLTVIQYGDHALTSTPDYIAIVFKEYNLLNSKNVNSSFKTFDEQIKMTIEHADFFNVVINKEYNCSLFDDFNKLQNTLWSHDNSPTNIGLSIVSSTINGVENNIITTTNTGFSDNMFANNMFGGVMNKSMYTPSIIYSSGNSFIKEYINNPEEPFSAISPIETYSNIYKNITDKNNNVFSMFSNMFKFSNISSMSSEHMFALIVNYFHKYTVSFNSIYNQVLFPGIIYNSAVYSTAVSKYYDIFGDNNGNPNAFTKFVRNYLKIVAKGDYFTNIYGYDEKNTTGDYNKDVSYSHLSTICEDYINSGYNKAATSLSVKNMPSINSKFISLLFSKELISEKDKDHKFRSSSLLSSLKRADAVETYIFVILLINKYMSYYNIDSNTDISYSSQVPQDPFGYRLDI